MNIKFKKYRVHYEFMNSKFGFTNSITLESNCPEFAERNAKVEIEKCYGTKMAKRFKIRKIEEL